MKKHIKIIYAIAAILFWIAVWQILAWRVGKTLLLPSPVQTVNTLLDLASKSDFWYICFSSVANIFVGALLGVVIGIAIAVLSYANKVIKYLFSPMLTLVKATPIASVIILFLVWIGKAAIPFWISSMMVVPIVASNVLEGLENISHDLKEVTRVYNFGFAKSWRLLYRYSLLPYFSSSLKSGIALSWKAGIAAEVLCTPEGTIGNMIYESKVYLETAELFAWTLTVIVLSLILEKAVVFASSRLMGGDRK
ncbi:MAG: ABC transporter permease subunit [Ruminococcaceae bacterium]|nr:ABC transporter permease subunit [Oscillospiraceae bacterium]